MTTASVKKFVFPITTGHTGTVYLANLFQLNTTNASIFHERTSYDSLGVHTPDASHFTLFNSLGNVDKVRSFWQQKLLRDSQLPQKDYVEVSHLLVKAGLLENIDFLTTGGHEVHLIILKRDFFKILWSFINRCEFLNTAFTWLWTLDFRYPNVIVPSKEFARHGMSGKALWYIYEMFTRAEYYKLLLSSHPQIHFHNVNLEDINDAERISDLIDEIGLSRINRGIIQKPPPMNTTMQINLGDEIKRQAKELLSNISIDPKLLASEYFNSGYRLATPVKRY